MKLKDITLMCADGLISEEQRDKIIKHYHLEPSSSGRWLFICLSLLSALLLVSGVGMLVSAHWEELTMLGKAAAGAVLLAAVWAVYFIVQGRVRLLAEGLAVIGAALWGGNILLHSTLFMPDVPFAEGCFLFFIGIALIPFLTPQRLLVGVVAITSAVLLSALMDVRTPSSWLYLPWLDDSKSSNFIAVAILLSIFWWLLGEKSRKSTGNFRGYYWVSYLAFLSFLLIIQAILFYPSSYEGILLTSHGYVVLSATPLLCLLLKPKGVGWLYWLLLTAGISLLAPLAIHLSWCDLKDATPADQAEMLWHTAYPRFYAAAAAAIFSAILMLTGSRCRRIAWINYGALMAVLTIIGVLSNIFKSLDNSAFILLISGTVVLALALVLESQRRRLIKKAEQQQPTHPAEA